MASASHRRFNRGLAGDFVDSACVVRTCKCETCVGGGAAIGDAEDRFEGPRNWTDV